MLYALKQKKNTLKQILHPIRKTKRGKKQRKKLKFKKTQTSKKYWIFKPLENEGFQEEEVEKTKFDEVRQENIIYLSKENELISGN